MNSRVSESTCLPWSYTCKKNAPAIQFFDSEQFWMIRCDQTEWWIATSPNYMSVDYYVTDCIMGQLELHRYFS